MANYRRNGVSAEISVAVPDYGSHAEVTFKSHSAHGYIRSCFYTMASNSRRPYMTFHHTLALALTLALTTSAANADPVVYASYDSGQFGTVNLSTGGFTPIGPGLPVAAGGLVQGSNGNLLT